MRSPNAGESVRAPAWTGALRVWRGGFRFPILGWVFMVSATLPVTWVPVACGQTPSVYYVNAANPNPAFPYNSWATAATAIQDAVDAAEVGGEIVVTNGVYATGGRPVDGALPNRVALAKAVRLRSVNGPAVTVIEGARAPGGGTGTGATRCVYLAEGASLSGFTLTNGATLGADAVEREQHGGGVWCASTNAVVEDCVITGNAAGLGGGAAGTTLVNCRLTGNTARDGGGAYGATIHNSRLSDNHAEALGGGVLVGTLYNSTLTGNSAGTSGGGVQFGTLYHCTLTGNSGGGAFSSVLYNCIVYFNTLENWRDATFEYSCTTPLPPGPGNLAADPQFSTATHLSATSPCLGAGDPAHARGTDLDGEPWADTPAMGADQVWPGQSLGPLAMQIESSHTAVTISFPVSFTADNSGPILTSVWDFGDGTIVTNQPFISHAWMSAGSYTVRLTGYNDSVPEGVTSTARIEVFEPVHYVNVANPTPEFPYATWETAATNIQDAVGASTGTGFTVVVTNGVYQTGSVEANGPNRVVLANATLRSVNGPDVTIIDGGGTVRCVSLGANAQLSGFTLRNGARGGLVSAVTGVVTNCVITDNLGDGALGGTLYNCRLSRNVGLGASSATVYNSVLTDNAGGGASQSTLYQCTVTGNAGVGVRGGRAYNSIVYFNPGGNWTDALFETSCTTPLPPGNGNLTGDPRLATATHLSVGSPCVGAGNPTYASGVDVDGEAWANPPAMGADQVQAGQAVGPLTMQIGAASSSVAVGLPVAFVGDNFGRLLNAVWDFADGTTVTNQPFPSHAWALPGTYNVRFTGFSDSQPEGVSASVQIQILAAVHYVNPASANPVFPYTSWETAAKNIADALSAGTVPGFTVLVTNGVYQRGTVLVRNAFLRSVNGPEATIIDGGRQGGGVRLEGQSVLSGFTVRNGWAESGAGVLAVAANGFTPVITNCLLAANWAYGRGGGASGGTLYNCLLTDNWAFDRGGGASQSTLFNCVLRANLGLERGGGAFLSSLYNCTVVSNTAAIGAGVAGGRLSNSIVYFNTGSSQVNWAPDTATPGAPILIEYTCTTPLPSQGVGNIEADPAFTNVGGADLSLRAGSPCIDAGGDLSAFLSTDLLGVPRPLDGNSDGVARFDMGAYEFNQGVLSPVELNIRRTDTSVQLTLTGQAGMRARVEQSANLQGWQELTTVTIPSGGQSVLTVVVGPELGTFYRAVSVP